MAIHFNNPLVALVSNQDVAVRQKSCSHGYVELVEACAGHASVLTVLPNNGALLIHYDDAIVRAAIYRIRTAGKRGSDTARNAGAGNERELAHALRIIWPTMECGPGLSAPSPKVQTTLCVSGSISM